MKAEWTFSTRYDLKVAYDGWRDTYVKPLESEFGQYVSYSAYENLLKAIDSLEERGLGYWLGDEFIVYEDEELKQFMYFMLRFGVGTVMELS